MADRPWRFFGDLGDYHKFDWSFPVHTYTEGLERFNPWTMHPLPETIHWHSSSQHHP